MKKDLALFLIMAGGSVPFVNAQSVSNSPSIQPYEAYRDSVLNNYDSFRQKVLDDYEIFRVTVLDHYADFLNGTWHEYEPLMPIERDRTPKPMKVPDVKISKPSTLPKELPKPVLADLPPGHKDPMIIPDEPEPVSDEIDPTPVVPPEAGKIVPPSLKVKPDLATPILATLPETKRPEPRKLPVEDYNPTLPVDANVGDDVSISEIDLPIIPRGEEPEEGKEPVNFYGMEILVPSVDFEIMDKFSTVGDFARSWKMLEKQGLAETLIDTLKPEIDNMGLNDYLTYEFLCAYLDSKFPNAGVAPKMSAVHYILSNLGYNVRIASTGKTGDPLLLVPSKQTIFGKSYLTIDGAPYYIMSAPGVDVMNQGIATCDLPKAAGQGKQFNMIVNELNIPVKERPFEIKYGNLVLQGVINENLMPIVYNYPQMNTAGYAQSELDGSLRTNLVNQIKDQLKDKDTLAATNELLQFVQSGFEYATDDEQHGFEKPYFLEENLYYPKNDCEDRAIFYTYMLWNALGVENQLLFFPGHESVGVAVNNDIGGTSYNYNGKRYYISDPTYIGSLTGMCMPQYSEVAPQIDLSIPEQ